MGGVGWGWGFSVSPWRRRQLPGTCQRRRAQLCFKLGAGAPRSPPPPPPPLLPPPPLQPRSAVRVCSPRAPVCSAAKTRSHRPRASSHLPSKQGMLSTATPAFLPILLVGSSVLSQGGSAQTDQIFFFLCFCFTFCFLLLPSFFFLFLVSSRYIAEAGFTVWVLHS